MPTMKDVVRHADLPAAGPMEKRLMKEFVLVSMQYEELVVRAVDGIGEEPIKDMIARHLSMREDYEE